MPSKASRSNGNGHCKIHSRAAVACRACLVQGLRFLHSDPRFHSLLRRMNFLE